MGWSSWFSSFLNKLCSIEPKSYFAVSHVFFLHWVFFLAWIHFSFHTKSETVWGPPFERGVWTFNKKKFDLHILSFLGSFSGAQQSEIKSKHVSSSSRLSYCYCPMRTWHQLLGKVVRAPTCDKWLRKIRHGFPFK